MVGLDVRMDWMEERLVIVGVARVIDAADEREELFETPEATIEEERTLEEPANEDLLAEAGSLIGRDVLEIAEDP